jgi:hypothetical protein
MSLIDSYSLFKKDLNWKTKYLLSACSVPYELLHRPNKKGEVVLYLSAVPDCIESHSHRKPAMSLSISGNIYISGLYIPDLKKSDIAFGDVKGTEDAILCLIGENQLEIFIAKGKKALSHQFYQLFHDGADPELDAEIADHRQRALKALAS